MSNPPDTRPARYRYYANEGADLFNLVLLAVEEIILDPTNARQRPRLGHTVPLLDFPWREGYVLLWAKPSFECLTKLGLELSNVAMKAMRVPSRRLGGKSAFELLCDHVDALETFSDFRHFDQLSEADAPPDKLTRRDRAIEAFMADSFNFAFISTLRSALRTLNEKPDDDKHIKAEEFWPQLRSTLASKGYVANNIVPLASTGFALLSNEFLEINSRDIPLSEETIHLPSEQLSEWVQTAHGLLPRVRLENQHFLKRIMAQDGRGERQPYERSHAHDGTSSGCPVRHNVPPIGEEEQPRRSGLDITVDLCLLAIDEVTALHASQERERQNLAKGVDDWGIG